jgi:hypothetical protein
MSQKTRNNPVKVDLFLSQSGGKISSLNEVIKVINNDKNQYLISADKQHQFKFNSELNDNDDIDGSKYIIKTKKMALFSIKQIKPIVDSDNLILRITHDKFDESSYKTDSTMLPNNVPIILFYGLVHVNKDLRYHYTIIVHYETDLVSLDEMQRIKLLVSLLNAIKKLEEYNCYIYDLQIANIGYNKSNLECVLVCYEGTTIVQYFDGKNFITDYRNVSGGKKLYTYGGTFNPVFAIHNKLHHDVDPAINEKQMTLLEDKYQKMHVAGLAEIIIALFFEQIMLKITKKLVNPIYVLYTGGYIFNGSKALALIPPRYETPQVNLDAAQNMESEDTIKEYVDFLVPYEGYKSGDLMKKLLYKPKK